MADSEVSTYLLYYILISNSKLLYTKNSNKIKTWTFENGIDYLLCGCIATIFEIEK